MASMASVFGLAAMLIFPAPARAVVLALPGAASFSWGSFLSGTTLGTTYVTNYVTPAGGAGGSVGSLDVPILALDSNPLDRPMTVSCNGGLRCKAAGTLSAQSVLWQGIQGRGYSLNREGAAVMGGFTPAGAVGADQFSFLQTYTDAVSPSGTIDGGAAYGRVNADYVRWTPSTAYGWNYRGSAVPYDFMDVPYDRIGVDPKETVRFETALARYAAGSGQVDILAMMTWSFTTGSGGAAQTFLTGTPIGLESAPSAQFLSLYATAFPGFTYRYVGGVADAVVAEPPAAWLLAAAMLGLVAVSRRRARLAA